MVVSVHTAATPPADEWNSYLVFCADLVAEFRGQSDRPWSVVFTDGGAPTTEQRRALVDIVGKHAFTNAVVTTSRVTRGVVTLLGWFAPGIQAYSPLDVEGILRHGGLSRDALPELIAVASRLAVTCGGNGVFDRFMAAASGPAARAG